MARSKLPWDSKPIARMKEMQSKFHSAQTFALAVLALWLGLWPGLDLSTGASKTMVLVPGGEISETACDIAMEIVEDCGSRACSSGEECCPFSTSRCGDVETSRCSRCFALGGLVFFSNQPLTIEPDLQLCGTICFSCIDCPDRNLQPPVPPPLNDFLMTV